MGIIEILKGLLTPMIGLVTIYIAYQQYQFNKKQSQIKTDIEKHRLKFDLYDKRYRIFKEVKDVLFEIIVKSGIDTDKLRDFKFSVNESRFLFDDKISFFLEELKDKAIELRDLGDKLDRLVTNQQSERKEKDRDRFLREWFRNEYESIEERFYIYLNLDNLPNSE